LGLTKVKDACEKIQHFGARRDESGTVEEPDETKSLANIKRTLTEVKDAYDEVVTLLKRFYGERA
jgi:osomolarity two-component system phosphorelay intermediate protein YPD1